MEIRNVTNPSNIGTAILRTSAKWGDNITSRGISSDVRRNGNYNARVRLVAHSSFGEGVRESASGRRGPWVCWHAQRDFFRELFAIEPTAVVRTGLGRGGVTYTAANFEATFPDTYRVNAGSLYYPRAFGTLCGHGGREAVAGQY
ncbi:hypothetical protein SEA_TUNATARTARE_260 [Streptomyces phage TunaTartare]|uniref:Hydrolase n=1 Tax=Streptomyces phage TunaTartare TaxID=2848887 RepID=A0A8F2IWJ6_9CAUD|nr:hypothetical protein PP457_gp020 [Streptomyces phage TunaTartare]QWT30122.1 hypothetical protein SEA_TUNATARTARE_260 [Streptomyces phage TunaTartare]